MLELESLSEQILGAAIEVHRELGPGFLEGVYEESLCEEFAIRGLAFAVQVPVQLFYKGRPLKRQHRIDLVVENAILIEVKAVEKVLLVHECQLNSYLRAMGKTVGFVLNFNVPLMKDGIHRRVQTAKGKLW